jgi:hypothetical protein
VQLINSTRCGDKEREMLIIEDEPHTRPQCFPEEWYPKLSEQCEQFMHLPGFGPHVVQSFATSMTAKNMSISLESGWQPSKEWVSAEQSEEHKITLSDSLEEERLKLKHLSGSDEFGMHYLSQAKWKWEKVGAKRVENYMKEDTRQLMGDMAHNAEGDLIAVHTIFDGKTERSLPSLQSPTTAELGEVPLQLHVQLLV